MHRSSDYHNLVDLFIGEIIFCLFSSLQDYYIRKQIIKALSLMRTTSSSSKLSKTIYQTSSNILQTHISMSKTYPILSNRMHAYVQSQKLIESSNQTSLNILKQVHTRTHSQYAKRLVSFSIRLEEPDKIVIGLPFTIPST